MLYWEDNRFNPNREPVSRIEGGQVEVQLAGNASGHFVADGRINGERVTFLLDTCATDVAVPIELAKRLGLERGGLVPVAGDAATPEKASRAC